MSDQHGMSRPEPVAESGPRVPDAPDDAKRQLERAVGIEVSGSKPDQPKTEEPSPEVERPVGAARMPGAPREGYTKMPTGPVGVEPVVASGPADTAGMPAVQWAPYDGSADEDSARLAPWALVAAIVALCASFFVGWGIPLAIVAVVAAIMSLRRPTENRAVARWALVLGLAATIYSLGWLIWATMQFEALG